jgi:uncharacterized membrane-anchored protein
VANKKNKVKENKKQESVNGPWLTMNSGLLVISLVSLGLAILTAWQAIPIKGFFQGILWGVIFGGSIWVVFMGAVFLNRLVRRKKD